MFSHIMGRKHRGTSDDIFNHCIKGRKHREMLYPEDSRITGLNKAEILAMAEERAMVAQFGAMAMILGNDTRQ